MFFVSVCQSLSKKGFYQFSGHRKMDFVCFPVTGKRFWGASGHRKTVSERSRASKNTNNGFCQFSGHRGMDFAGFSIRGFCSRQKLVLGFGRSSEKGAERFSGHWKLPETGSFWIRKAMWQSC